MEQSLFARFAENLRDRRNTLVEWLGAASPEEKQIRLGPAPEKAMQNHFDVIERAIDKAQSHELGRCTVCDEFVGQDWLERDFTTSVCIDHLSGEERSRLEAELELSQKVQQALLPQNVPQLPGWEVAAFSRPASIVGGDYYDFGRFANGHQAFVIADVMGKGMPASMLMASLQASLKIIIPESTDPCTVMGRINHIFYHNIHLTKFVTLVVAELDTASGTVRYANAGHNPPYLVRQTNGAGAASTELLPPTGAAIGLIEEARFEAKSVQLRLGDALVFYTDGVTDAGVHSGTMFGEERLSAYIRENHRQPAGGLLRGILQEVQTFTRDAAPSDDTTIMIVKRTGVA